VLNRQPRGGSRAPAPIEPINTVLRIAAEGLVLGAGTVLLPAGGPRQLRTTKGCEARVLALLSAAYGTAIDPAVLGNIERAAKAWNAGDDCLAYIHLAHARLGELPYPHAAAQRLVIVDAFLKAGGSPRTVFKGLKLDAPYIDALEKDYNPEEPRVPPGSGKPSGEWTRGGGGEAARPPVPSFAPPAGAAPRAASWLARLAPSAAVALSRFALTIITGAGGAVATFGLLFIPSPNNVRVEGEVEGMPGLRYSWNRDEAAVHFTYDANDGTRRTFTAWRQGDEVRDVTGKVIGRVLPGDVIAFDLAAIAPGLVKQNEPKLCPEPPVHDIRGSDQGKDYKDNRSRQYEDYIKKFINSPPTPSGLVYELRKKDGKPVTYDDCQRNSGTLIEIKGPRYAYLLRYPDPTESIEKEFLDKAKRQVEASGGRPIVWIFAEPEAAQYAERLFAGHPELKRIIIIAKRWEREPR
jgi:hypothetical protein